MVPGMQWRAQPPAPPAGRVIDCPSPGRASAERLGPSSYPPPPLPPSHSTLPFHLLLQCHLLLHHSLFSPLPNFFCFFPKPRVQPEYRLGREGRWGRGALWGGTGLTGTFLLSRLTPPGLPVQNFQEQGQNSPRGKLRQRSWTRGESGERVPPDRFSITVTIPAG